MIVLLFFLIIAAFRVVQSICGKRVSIEVKNTKTFFCFGVYYEVLAVIAGLIPLATTGFSGFNPATVACGAVTAAFLMINFYAQLNAVKGCNLIVSSMAGNGGMLIACFVSSFWFNESIGVTQYVGLALFLTSVYLITSAPKATENRQQKKISKATWVLLAVVTLSESGVEVSQKFFSVRIGGNAAWYSFFMFATSSLIMAIGLAKMQLKERSLKKSLDENYCVACTDAPKEPKKFCLNKVLLICGAAEAVSILVVNLLITELGKTVDTVVLFPVSASIGICITVLVGWIVYKEKLTLKNILGVVIGLCAVILLAI